VKRALSFERPLREVRLPERRHIETSMMDGTILPTTALRSSAAAGLAVRFACESAAKLNASAGWGEKQQCLSGENHPKLDASSNRNQD